MNLELEDADAGPDDDNRGVTGGGGGAEGESFEMRTKVKQV